MKKILSISLTSLSLILFLAAIYIMVGSSLAVKKNELFSVFGYSYAVVPTPSMEGSNPDSFNRGDAVIIYKTPYEQLNIGDIVVYKSEKNILIIHRIIEDTTEGFIVKGDNNTDSDEELVNINNYQGKYQTHFKFFNIGLWLSDARNLMLTGLVLVLLGSVLYQLFSIIIQVKRHKLEAFKKSLEEKDNEEDTN